MKKIFSNIILCIMAVIFVVSLYKLYTIFDEYNDNRKIYKEVSNIVKGNGEISIGEDEYQKLKGINEDYLFWLFVPNTNINYPVVRAEDNNKYLYKNFKGEENKGGSIFVDAKNTVEDENVVIHGHNMKDESMFGTLSNVLETEYLNENNNIYIYLENKILQYEIFSVYVTSGEDYPYKNKFDNDEEFDNYIDLIMSKSFQNLSYFENDKKNIITLSTCTNASGDERTIVHAKLKEIKDNDKN